MQNHRNDQLIHHHTEGQRLFELELIFQHMQSLHCKPSKQLEKVSIHWLAVIYLEFAMTLQHKAPLESGVAHSMQPIEFSLKPNLSAMLKDLDFN